MTEQSQDTQAGAESSAIERDRQLLIDARKKGKGAMLRTFIRLSGPAWIQSAITLGACDIPVVMVTGDDKTVKEARALLGDDIVTAQVKEGLSREGALMHSPKRARAMIREGAKEAMTRTSKVKPYKQEFPAKVRWQFLSSDIVKRYQGAARRIDDRTLEKIVHRPEDIISP